MTLRVVTQPSFEPISLSDARTWCRIPDGFTDDDSLIENVLIPAMRERAEDITRRAFCQQTLELTLPCFSPCIELPRPPLIQVESVKYVDADGDVQTVDPDIYQIDSYREPALIAPAYQQVWPAIVRGEFNAVRIRYTAGYLLAGSPRDGTLPAKALAWMRIRIASLYEHRESLVIGNIVANLPRDHVDGLLDSLCVDVF